MSAAASNASANGAGASSISSTMLQGLRDQDAVAWSRLVKVLGPVDTFRGWLWRITQNKIRNYLQRWKKHPNGAGGTDAQVQFQQLAVCEPSDSQEPSDPDSDCLILHAMLELIREDFEHNTWQAFWRMAVQGHSAAEIGADLGMTQEAVRQAKRRIVRRLEKDLEGIF